MVSVAAPHSAKPRSASRFRAPLYQTIKGRPRAAIDLVVFGLNIDDNELLGVFLNVDLRLYDTLEDLISLLSTVGLSLRHCDLQQLIVDWLT